MKRRRPSTRERCPTCPARRWSGAAGRWARRLAAALAGVGLALPATAGLVVDPVGEVPLVQDLGDDLLVRGDFTGQGTARDYALVSLSDGIVLPLLAGSPTVAGTVSATDYSEGTPFFGGDTAPRYATTLVRDGQSQLAVLGSSGNALSLFADPAAGPIRSTVGLAQPGARLLVPVAHGTGSGADGGEDLVAAGPLDAEGGAGTLSFQVLLPAGKDPPVGALGKEADDNGFAALALEPLDLDGTEGHALALLEHAGGEGYLGLRALQKVAAGAEMAWIDGEPVSASPLAAGTHLAFGPFAGNADEVQVLVVEPGGGELTAATVSPAGINPQDPVDFRQGDGLTVDRVRVLGGLGTPLRLLVVYGNGDAQVLQWDGLKEPEPVAAALPPPKGASWLGVLAAADGSFQLLSGSGGRVSGRERFAYDSGDDSYASLGWEALARASDPATLTVGSPVQAVAYSGTPLEEEGLQAREIYQRGDWASGQSGSLELTTETFGGSASGLGSASTASVGSLPAGTTAAINQQGPAVSLWFGLGTASALSPRVTLTPPGGTGLTAALEVALATESGAGIFYREQGESGWIAAGTTTASLPVVVDDVTYEVTARDGAGLWGPVEVGAYSFADSGGERDTDGDGLPDSLEAEIGSDPFAADSDGDGFSDLVELIADRAAGGAFGGELTDASVYPGSAATGSAALAAAATAREAARIGEVALEVTVEAEAPLANSYGTDLAALAAAPRSLASLSAAPVGPAAGDLFASAPAEGILAEGSDTLSAPGPARTLGPFAMAGPGGLLYAGTGPRFDLVPLGRALRSDFASGSGNWQVPGTMGSWTSPTRLVAGGPDGSYAALVDSATTQRRELVERAAAAAHTWAIDYGPAEASGLDRIEGVRAMVLNLDPAATGFLHYVLQSGSTIWASEGLPLAADGEWVDALVPLEAAFFERLAGTDDFATVLAADNDPGGGGKSVGWFLSDEGVLAVSGGEPRGSSAHAGFRIDRIRAVGRVLGGARLLAAREAPSPDFARPVFPEGTAADREARLDAWITAWQSARDTAESAAGLTLSPESTVVALLLEEALQQRAQTFRADSTERQLWSALSTEETASFPTVDGGTGEVAVASAPAALTGEDLDFLRYPAADEGFPTDDGLLISAIEPLEVLTSLEGSVAGSWAGGDALADTAVAVYRLAASYEGTDPGALGAPLQALRAVLREGADGLPDPDTEAGRRAWKGALADLGLDTAALESAESIADGYLATALADATRSLLMAEVAVGSAVDDWTGVAGTAYAGTVFAPLTRAGEPFPLPEGFAFPEGSTLLVEGYDRGTNTDGQRELELTSVDLLSLPRTTPADTDGNLLEDSWEVAFFGATGQDFASDADGDGLNLLSEFLHGTDPLSDDAGSLEEVPWPPRVRIEVREDGDFELVLPMDADLAANFLWTVEESTTLTSFAGASGVTESPAASEQRFVIPDADLPAVFFRLRAALQ